MRQAHKNQHRVVTNTNGGQSLWVCAEMLITKKCIVALCSMSSDSDALSTLPARFGKTSATMLQDYTLQDHMNKLVDTGDCMDCTLYLPVVFCSV